ncbi:hypothetical protein AB6A40_007823 [Gnathostoma spinigerum]|uniref:Uncharacterized protein n=1 Tax=Gnathostoma spinigerum TaxID=75299 RepID=A0ABD6ESI5_9BILA
MIFEPAVQGKSILNYILLILAERPTYHPNSIEGDLIDLQQLIPHTDPSPDIPNRVQLLFIDSLTSLMPVCLAFRISHRSIAILSAFCGSSPEVTPRQGYQPYKRYRQEMQNLNR